MLDNSVAERGCIDSNYQAFKQGLKPNSLFVAIFKSSIFKLKV